VTFTGLSPTDMLRAAAQWLAANDDETTLVGINWVGDLACPNNRYHPDERPTLTHRLDLTVVQY
jgi:hypothetical protein